MTTVFFLGAGASAADGIPVTDELNHGVADFLCSDRGKGSALRHYYRELYRVGDKALMRAAGLWRAFIDDRELRPRCHDALPGIIETLSMLDIALQEGNNFGVRREKSGKRNGFLDEPLLATARMELSMAIGRAIGDTIKNHRTPLAHAFVQQLKRGDSIVSSNWDTLIERALTRIQEQREDTRYIKATNIRYAAVNERLVDRQGDGIKGRVKSSTTILKLHGSLNWFYCPCCTNLYANVQGVWIIDPIDRRPTYDECHCGAWLENLTIAPSFVKSYRNIHIRSTWHYSQRALEEADNWVFIGYRLPADDFHIRALLLRSLRINISLRDEPPRIFVVARKSAGEIEQNYSQLFRLAQPKFIDGGLKGWLESPRLA